MATFCGFYFFRGGGVKQVNYTVGSFPLKKKNKQTVSAVFCPFDMLHDNVTHLCCMSIVITGEAASLVWNPQVSLPERSHACQEEPENLQTIGVQ